MGGGHDKDHDPICVMNVTIYEALTEDEEENFTNCSAITDEDTGETNEYICDKVFPEIEESEEDNSDADVSVVQIMEDEDVVIEVTGDSTDDSSDGDSSEEDLFDFKEYCNPPPMMEGG